MIRWSDRTRRGFLEAVGLPTVLGGLMLVLLLLGQMAEVTA